MSVNPLVNFLAAYGPTPSSNNMYDEFVLQAARSAELDPLDFEQPKIAEIRDMLAGDSPRTVILTGTAGDGKTYTARKVFGEIALGQQSWDSDAIEQRLGGGKGVPIHFIKDLSEISEGEKDRIFPDLMDSMADPSPERVYVICVNDGHLLKFWRDRIKWEADGLGEKAAKIHKTLESMLQKDESESPSGELRLSLINMSRQPHHFVLDNLFEAILNHGSWDKCQGCEYFQREKGRCPIQVNREILLSEIPNSIKERLKGIIEIAAADDMHLSIRQIILAVVNALLGDAKNSSRPLLTCQSAKRRASEGEYRHTNPFTNLFGENLGGSARAQYTVYQVLGGFGIGHETNNSFDGLLLGSPQEERLPDDGHYGEAAFAREKSGYVSKPEKYGEFRDLLVAQRRRAFFTAVDPGGLELSETDSWNLSVYKHGSSYLKLLKHLREEDEGTNLDFGQIARKIVNGLNRLFTGFLTSEKTRLWLTDPSGVFGGRETPLISTDAIRIGPGPGLHLEIERLERSRHGRPPRLVILQGLEKMELGSLELTPTIYEFLCCVSDGNLTGTFSNQCMRKIEQFRLTVSGAIQRNNRKHGYIPPLKVVECYQGALRDVELTSIGGL